MSQLSKLWAGRIYGTNTGNFFLKFDQTAPKLKGRLRFLDAEYGVALYDIQGTFEDSLELKGSPAGTPVEVNLGDLEVTAKLTSEGHLRGEWVSSIGTGGIFVAYPHFTEMPDPNTQIPEQFFTHTVAVGAVGLYGQDLASLVVDLRRDFTVGRPVATYSTGAGEVTKYAEDFLAAASTLGKLTYLKLQIQEHEAHGIYKVAVVELRRYGLSEVRAQGASESWTIGTAETLAARLKLHQNVLVTAYKKFGLNLNQALFLVMLVLIPEFTSMGKRAIFVLLIFAMLHALLWAHSRLVPNADIRVSSLAPTQWARIWPSILSFLFAVTASIVAAYIYAWLIAF